MGVLDYVGEQRQATTGSGPLAFSPAFGAVGGPTPAMLLVVAKWENTATDAAIVAPFTEDLHITYAGGAFRIGHRVAQFSDPSSYSQPFGTGASKMYLNCMTWQNGDTGVMVLDDAQVDSGAGSTLNLPGVTAVADADVVAGVIIVADLLVISTPSGYAQDGIDQDTFFGFGASWWGRYTASASGTLGPWPGSQTDPHWASVTYASQSALPGPFVGMITVRN